MQHPGPYAPPAAQPPQVAQAPVAPRPQYVQPPPSTGYPTQPTGIAPAQPLPTPFDSPSNGKIGTKMIVGGIIVSLLVLAGGGFGGYFLGKDAGVAEATGGTPDDAYAGKWFSVDCWSTNWPCDYSAIWLKEDGAVAFWDTPFFQCSDGMHIHGSNVNDEDNDCLDGTDEGTTRADNFNSDLNWVDRNGMKIANHNPTSYSDYFYLDLTWGINDDEKLCISYRMTNDDNFVTAMTTCQKVWLSNDAVWHKYEMIDDDAHHAGTDETDCNLMVRMSRSSGPPDDVNQAWTDLMELEISEAMVGKPSACSGTTYQELTEGFDDDDDY